MTFANKNTQKRFERLTKLNETEMKQLLMCLGKHATGLASKILGYNSQSNMYKMIKAINNQVPALNEIYENRINLVSDSDALEKYYQIVKHQIEIVEKTPIIF